MIYTLDVINTVGLKHIEKEEEEEKEVRAVQQIDLRLTTGEVFEGVQLRRILASDLKAASESLRRMHCFIEPTAR